MDTSHAANKKMSPVAPTETTEIIVASQSSIDDHFSSDAWQSMIADLEPDAERVLNQFNIRLVMEMANVRQLPRGKVPVFCAVIESVSARGADACVMLRDPTGKISGTIHREVIKEYAMYIQPGTVLVLRQVSLLSPLGRNYYLNITPNNVVRLYPRNEHGSGSSLAVLKLRDLTPDDLEIALPLPAAAQRAPFNCTTVAASLMSPVRPSVVLPVSPRSFATPSRLNSPRVPIGASPSSAIGTPRTSTRLPPQQNLSYSRPTFAAAGRPSARVPTNALRPLENNTFVGRGSPAVVGSSKPSFVAGNQRMPDKLTASSAAAVRLSSDFSRTMSAPAAASPGTSKFTFRRTSTATPTSAASDRCASNNSSLVKNRNVNAAAEANRRLDQSNGCSVPSGHRATTTVDEESASADLWKTDDVDDEVLFNLSAEFLSDF